MAEESPEPGRGAGSETGPRPREVDCGQGELHRRRPGADQVQRGTGTAYRDWTGAGGSPARERHARTARRPPVAARGAAEVPGHRTTAARAVRTVSAVARLRRFARLQPRGRPGVRRVHSPLSLARGTGRRIPGPRCPAPVLG